MTSERDPDGLDAFFVAASKAPEPKDDLVARVLADAATVQAGTAAVAPKTQPRFGLWDALGGWLPVSGLAAACAAGIAIGVILPGAASTGLNGTLSTWLEGQQAVGFAGFEAVSFAEGGISE